MLLLPGYRYPVSLDEPLTSGDLRNSFNLSRALVRAGAQVTVISRLAKGDPWEHELGGVMVRRYRPELGRVFPTSFDVSLGRLRLFRNLRRDADVVVASSPLTLELLTPPTPPVFYICSGLEDVRNYGATTHEALQGLGIRLLRDPAKHITWRRSTAVNTTAELEAATLERLGVARDRILTITSGVETERYRPVGTPDVAGFRRDFLPPESHGRRLVLSVSRFTPAKGIVETLRAFARLNRLHPDVFLLLVGVRHSHLSGYLEHVRQTIASLRLGGDVAIRENVPESRLPDCYSAADVTTVFSVGYDPLPTVIIESMACGTPVVATNFEPRTQMITDGVNGVLVPERDESAWVAAVQRILSDPVHAAALREAGLARVRERFDMNDVAARYLNEFRAA